MHSGSDLVRAASYEQAPAFATRKFNEEKEVETERDAFPRMSDRPWPQATPTLQEAGDASTGPQAGVPGNTVRAGLERAGVYVKDAVDKTREKMAGYREAGIEQVSQDIVEYVRSQPMTALLIATGVGLFAGMLLTLGRK